ncbi:hypothetical protein LWM68_02770 [Niabella sp. W65]|nr:hypothetical protein [Niabella sp. W65]MCH7361793.1 ABC transporter transmembrane domain-containing protein [Niabella sp. W65]
MIFGTLALTLVGSVAAQVNPLVLKYTVDHVDALIQMPAPMKEGLRLLGVISVILFAKEIVNIFIQFGQKFYGEKIRINVSNALAQKAIRRILSYHMGFLPHRRTSRVSCKRVSTGVWIALQGWCKIFSSILPLFCNAILALVIMFMANVYVGLIAVTILPAYFYVSARQAKKLQGVRRQLRGGGKIKAMACLTLLIL